MEYYTSIIQNYEVSLQIQSQEIDTLSSVVTDYAKIIEDQNIELINVNKKQKIYTGIAIGGITLSVSLLLILLIAN